MAHQGTGDQSSAHIINHQKKQAASIAALDEFLTPVTSEDELCKKFALYQRREYLSSEEIEQLWAVFDHFAIKHEDGPYWNEGTFINFLSAVLPAKSTLRLEATPIMYELFCQLGSYPYHSRPVGDTLTFDQMALAIQILARRFHYYKVYDNEDELPLLREPMPEVVFCRLIWQSLTASDAGRCTSPDRRKSFENVFETKDGIILSYDEDLQDVWTMLFEFSERGMVYPEEFGQIFIGPQMPEVYSFRSSFSNELSGKLSEDRLRYLLEFLFANRLCKTDKQDVEEEAEVVLHYIKSWDKAFRGKASSDGMVGWKGFQRTMCAQHAENSLVAKIFPALQRIFAPCLRQDWVQTVRWLDSLEWKRDRSG